jgi:hypothetical protein
MSDAAPDPNATIVCRVTSWYYRRMGLVAAMFLGMGLYFLYDGRIGYPKENKIAAEKDRFEREVIGGPEGYESAAKLGEEFTAKWVQMAREKGWIVSPTLNEPRWADYAAERGWSDHPKKHSQDEIRQQYEWGGALIVVAVIAGLLVLKNHNKVLVGHADHMVMPNGVTVRYADVTCVDKRKWENKGLAYIHYRETAGAPGHRVTMDDLMYGGAEMVLHRLLAQFKGELIEKASVDEEESVDESTSTSHAPGQESSPKA